MSPGLRRVVGGVLAAAAVLVLAALTRVPYSGAAEDEARVRLSWRIRSEQVRTCVPPTEEELERLPPHMRNPDACVGDVPPFRLRVRLDDRTVVDRRVRASGARGDRPMYVLHDVPVTPGPHRLAVEFQQERDGDEAVGRRERPLELELEADVDLEPREVVLVTLESGTGQLVLRR